MLEAETWVTKTRRPLTAVGRQAFTRPQGGLQLQNTDKETQERKKTAEVFCTLQRVEVGSILRIGPPFALFSMA